MSASSSSSSSGGADGELLGAFVSASDRIVDKTLAQYTDFVRRRRRVVDVRQWTLIARERGVDLYQERVEAQRRPLGPDIHDEVETTMVSAFGGGALPGSLDEILRGLYADSTDAVKQNAAIQFGPQVLGCGVVRTFQTRSQERPHEFFGVKFVDRMSRISGVLDQLCWVERMGTKQSASGQKFGFHLIKSVDADGDEHQHGELAVRPIKMSVCYLYAQSGASTVNVFIRGIVELPVMKQVKDKYRQKEAVRAAANYILAAVRGRECQRMSTIAQLIVKSKTDREQLTACHCSKVIKGLSKMEMCSGCREAMRRPKLVALNDANDRKHGSTAPSKSLEHLRLQSRLGSTRKDGELTDSQATASYCESESFRMFLPIHDGRSESAYRTRRQQSDNVLIKMLRRHHHKLQASAVSSASEGSGRTATSSAA